MTTYKANPFTVSAVHHVHTSVPSTEESCLGLRTLITLQLVFFAASIIFVRYHYIPFATDGFATIEFSDGLNAVVFALTSVIAVLWGLRLDVPTRGVFLIALLPVSCQAALPGIALALDFPVQIIAIFFLPSMLAGAWRAMPRLILAACVLLSLLGLSSLLGDAPMISLRALARFAVYLFSGLSAGVVLASHPVHLMRALYLLASGACMIAGLVVARVLTGTNVGDLGQTFAAPFVVDRGSGAAYICWGVVVLAVANSNALAWRRSLIRVGLLATALAVILSGTRAALVGLVVLLIAMTLSNRRYIPVILLVIISVTGLFAVARSSVFMTQLSQRVLPFVSGGRAGLQEAVQTVSSAEERLRRWRIAGEMVQAYPLFGIGYERFQDWVVKWPTAPYMAAYSVHSESLKMAAEGGLPSFAAYVSLVLGSLVAGLRRIRKISGDANSFLLIAMLGVLVYTVQGVFNNYQQISKVTIPYFFLIAVAYSIASSTATPESAVGLSASSESTL